LHDPNASKIKNEFLVFLAFQTIPSLTLFLNHMSEFKK